MCTNPVTSISGKDVTQYHVTGCKITDIVFNGWVVLHFFAHIDDNSYLPDHNRYFGSGPLV